MQNPAELFNSVWLGSNPAKSVLLKIGHDRIVGISAGHNGSCLRINTQQLLDSLLTAHPTGDGQVHDDHVVEIPVPSGQLVAVDEELTVYHQIDPKT